MNISAVRPPSSGACGATFPLEGEGFFGLCVASRNTSEQRRSRLLAPRLGRGSLCGNDWWVRLIFDICAASLRMTRWGTGARYVICLVQMLASLARPHPSLRATFPLEGEGSFGGAWLYVIPLNNGDPAPPPAFEPSEAKGKTLRHHPKPRLEPPLGKSSKNPKASPQRAPETQYVTITYHLTGALCGEVLGVLRTFSERRF